MESEKFCLRWNDFKLSISESLEELREEKDFFDVTLACDDDQVQAHKVVLSACSPFFRNVLRRNPHQHPLLYLKGVKHQELLSVINFMYLGEVSVAQEDLNSFLNVAEDLRVKGLTQSSSSDAVFTNAEPKQDSAKLLQSGKKSSWRNSNPNRSSHKSTPSSANGRSKPPHQVHHYQNKENYDVLETGPVKLEPVESTVRSFQAQSNAMYDVPEHQITQQDQTMDYDLDQSVNHEQEQAQEPEQEQELEPEQGTVAKDGTYGVSTAYEYQYEENPDYQEDYLPGEVEGGTDLDSVVLSKMSKNNEGVWQCNECYRTSKQKANIMEHIEAAHVHSSGFNCDICYKVFKTKHSLRTHKNKKHKECRYYQ